MSRINKDLEVSLFRKVISDLAPYFEINLNEFYNTSDNNNLDPYTIFKQFTKIMSQRVGILKDKLHVLIQNKDLLMQERA